MQNCPARKTSGILCVQLLSEARMSRARDCARNQASGALIVLFAVLRRVYSTH